MIKMVLIYKKGIGNGPADITGYRDSDWAGNLDNCKSTSRYVFKLASTAVTRSLQKQWLVAQSTTKAKYIGHSEVAREAVWLCLLFYHLLAKYPINPLLTLHADNQGSIKLTENFRFHSQMKHIEIHYHFMQEAHQNGGICLAYLKTEAMTALEETHR
jgi:hypothetical protein